MVTTISDNIVTIKSPCDTPMQSLKAYFSPIQNGSGDPSPTNIRPIIGWTGLEVTRCGKNLFSLWNNGYWNAGSKKWDNSSAGAVCKPIHVNSGTTFIISQTNTSATYQFHEWDKYVSSTNNYTNDDNLVFATSVSGQGRTYTAQNDSFLTAFVNIGADTVTTRKVQLEIGSTPSSYEPYNGETVAVDWTSEAGTLYSGYVDLISGDLVADYGIVYAKDFTWNFAANENVNGAVFRSGDVEVVFARWISDNARETAMCNVFLPSQIGSITTSELNSFWWSDNRSGYRIVWGTKGVSTVEDLYKFLTDNNVVFCGKLASPIVYHLSQTQLNILRGYNNIFSNSNGPCEVTYDHRDTNEIINIRHNAIGSLPHQVTVSGSFVHFETDMAAPLIITGTGNITVCGKNFYNQASYPLTQHRMIDSTNGNSRNSSTYPVSSMPYIPCHMIAGKTVTLNHAPGNNSNLNPECGFAFFTNYLQSTYISGVANGDRQAGEPWTLTIPANAKYMRFSVPVDATDIQIEIGESASTYEAYTANSATAETVRKSLVGINNIWSDDGSNLTVTYWTH